jgi:DNA-binding transcriptional regulator LsrR (DeoR family)
VTREADEVTLRILRLHHLGLSRREIAHNVGLTRHQVAGQIAQVREQDCKHDPEEAPRYWRTR